MNKRQIRISKFLSLVLRHKPERIGLQLDAAGWASVDELIRLAKDAGTSMTRQDVEAVVAGNDKQRFALSPKRDRIRASQGHSIDIDLGLEARVPPDRLFHGTATRFLSSILEHGLEPQSRQHVHLSVDVATAVRVGQRHGRPVVLEVSAAAMASAGQEFFCSDNGVWLTSRVHPRNLREMRDGELK